MANVFLLILAAMIWGMGFIGIKWTLDDFSPLWANGFRYVIASVVAMPFLIYKRSFFMGMKSIGTVALAAFFLFGCMQLQTNGLVFTTVAKSGFITSFYAFFTPLLAMILFRKRFRAGFWGLIVVAMIGIFLLCDMKFDSFNMGDFYTFLCAIFASCHILLLGRVAHKFKSAIEFNALQCFFIAIMGSIVAFSQDGMIDLSPLLRWEALTGPSSLYGFLFMGILSSLIAFSIQVHTQKQIPVHIVGLIFLMESPFAAVFGWIFLGEALSTINILGCVLVLVAVVLVPYFAREIRPRSV